jgi:hypothetical protein
MRNYLTKIILALACAALVAVTVPVGAQTSNVGLSIAVLPSTTSPGTTVALAGLVTNNTSRKMRPEVTFTSLSPCGTEATVGFVKVALDPGQTKFVSGSYMVPADACLGMYTVTISAESSGGGKNSSTAAAESSASAYLEVR